MTRATGEIVEYHGRKVEILEVALQVATPTGSKVDVVKVKDPRRGIRSMFLWQLEAGIGAAPEKTIVAADEGFR